jgi:hypothetical protein|tara:strand:+ start:352 stop:546 length:195 start_codon:yes stop_codon:yes gene_type:complete
LSFISTVKGSELDVLRKIVKSVNFKHFPKEFVTDYEADKLIDSLAPSTVARLLRVGIDSGIADK